MDVSLESKSLPSVGYSRKSYLQVTSQRLARGKLVHLHGRRSLALPSVGPGNFRRNFKTLYKKVAKSSRYKRVISQHFANFFLQLGVIGLQWLQRTLINFLVYCPEGISFVKSVDALDIVKDATNLFQLFDEAIEWVGPLNVVHVVIDNAANYVVAGRLISQKHKHINWSLCAAHCLNLIFKDIGKIDHVAELILRPGATRFATTFIALKSLHDHKHDLQALVTSKFFVDSRYSKDYKSQVAVSIILDNRFWNDCLIVVNLMSPLMRLLHIVDCDERPSMGYVYEGMYRVRLGIKKLFNYSKKLYKPYTEIIKQHWDQQLKKSIHSAAYWLNPCFQYDQENFCNKPNVIGGVMDVIDQKVLKGKIETMNEMRLFRDRLGSFGRNLAYSSREVLQPDEWWRLHGYSAPHLQKLAIQILSQTASSSGCERNWSVFERIHTKRRNRLEHQRLNDLVYVHYNLRLKNRFYNKKRIYDPIDYACIDETDFWVVDDDQPTELDIEELENLLYEEGSIPIMKWKVQVLTLVNDEDGGDMAREGLDVENFAYESIQACQMMEELLGQVMAKLLEAQIHEETKLWSLIVLCLSRSKYARKKKQRGKQKTAAAVFFGTFGALPEVHFLHAIYHFKAQEVKNPTLQTVYDLKLKRGRYGLRKKTAPGLCETRTPFAHPMRGANFPLFLPTPL
ncbi:hypothetical protein CK203_112414 [Vitis vinifera]|uniref:HAT C-terminal dimerisation domain-containing protein n=1 Tax=Vitis vinifera TaxID=29760 RepID=A0A438CB58_VITVI|nr:hypothetical protein CK203_112414 [Vitis vinifera]